MDKEEQKLRFHKKYHCPKCRKEVNSLRKDLNEPNTEWRCDECYFKREK